MKEHTLFQRCDWCSPLGARQPLVTHSVTLGPGFPTHHFSSFHFTLIASIPTDSLLQTHSHRHKHKKERAKEKRGKHPEALCELPFWRQSCSANSSCFSHTILAGLCIPHSLPHRVFSSRNEMLPASDVRKDWKSPKVRFYLGEGEGAASGEKEAKCRSTTRKYSLVSPQKIVL